MRKEHYNWKMVTVRCCICKKSAEVMGNKKTDTLRTCGNRPCQIKRANLRKAERYRKMKAEKPKPKHTSIYELDPLHAARLPQDRFLRYCEHILTRR